MSSAIAAAAGAMALAACMSAETGWQNVQAKLLTPLASYSRVGTAFSVKLIGSVVHGHAASLPVGTVVHGTVRVAQSVGLGLKRERARLDLDFDSCELPSGERIHCEVRLLALDNAREEVSKDNRIQGVLAASHPNSLLSGMWFRPNPDKLHRSAAGLTGPSGMAYTRLVPGPIGAVVVIGSRLLLYRLPEPEIELPEGTELILRVAADVEPGVEASAAEPAPELPYDLLEWLRDVPSQVTTPERGRAADRINIALLGTRDEVVRAFEASGWTAADPLTAKTFMRTYSAFASMKAYEKAPVSTLHYRGRPPDLMLQKSFNSVAKRHHVRLWLEDSPAGQVWLGAATHDVAVTFDFAKLGLTHRIDPQIDRERSKIVNDLNDARCLAFTTTVERPEQAWHPTDGGGVVTDGALVLVGLKDCRHLIARSASPKKPHRNRLALIVRRVVLETRYYMTRGNAYYWAFKTARWGFTPKGGLRGVDE